MEVVVSARQYPLINEVIVTLSLSSILHFVPNFLDHACIRSDNRTTDSN